MEPGTPKQQGEELRREGDDGQTQLAPGRRTAATDTVDVPELAVDLAPGTMLGEYRIEQKLGEGGMGVVFLAVHPKIGKRAAIKVLKRELCEDPYTVERFQDEARVVNQIGHPNIVDVFAFGEMPGGRRYFVMEWLKGENLRARIARIRSPLAEVCGILRPLARALEAAHDKGVIHRDLKPDNVFLVDNREGAPTVKLLDFGIAKLAHTSEPRLERTATGAMVGTPMYIAPEQARGHAIDHRVDIYSLGAIAFELLTGRTPFIADNAMEMVAKHLMEAAPTVASVWPQVPAALDEVVTRMLAKDPAERPSLAALCAVLDEVKHWDVTTIPPRSGRLASSAAVSTLPGAPGRPRSVWRWLPIVLAIPVVGIVAIVALHDPKAGRGPQVTVAPIEPVVAAAAVPTTVIDAAVAVPTTVIDAAVALPAGATDATAAAAGVRKPAAGAEPARARPLRSPSEAAGTGKPVGALRSASESEVRAVHAPAMTVVTLTVPNARTVTVTVDRTSVSTITNGRGTITVIRGRSHHIDLVGAEGALASFGITPMQPTEAVTMSLSPPPPPVLEPATPVRPTRVQPPTCVVGEDGLMAPGCQP